MGYTQQRVNLVCRFKPLSRAHFGWLLLNVARPALCFIEHKHVLVCCTALVLFSAQAAGKIRLATTAIPQLRQNATCCRPFWLKVDTKGGYEKHVGWGKTEPSRVGWGNCLRSKVLTITMSGVFFVLQPSSVCLLSHCYRSSFPTFHPYLCLYLTICLWPSLTLKYQQCVEKRETTEREEKGGKRERGGVEKEREGETDEGRTAAGGCHGNREDCYTAHVNRRSLMGGERDGRGGGEGRGGAEKASMSR